MFLFPASFQAQTDPTGGEGTMKERYFVCRNKDANFVIDYYDGVDDEKGEKKGSVYVESSYVEKFDAEDADRFGTKFGIPRVTAC